MVLDPHSAGRIPRHLFAGLVPRYTEIAVLLEHHEMKRRCQGKRRQGLERSGYAIQQWAQQQWAKRWRRKTFNTGVLEREFEAMVQDGSIANLPGIRRTALPVIADLLDDVHITTSP